MSARMRALWRRGRRYRVRLRIQDANQLPLNPSAQCRGGATLTLSRYRRLNAIFERSKEPLIAFVAIALIPILGA
jgi:hypothetical protein